MLTIDEINFNSTDWPDWIMSQPLILMSFFYTLPQMVLDMPAKSETRRLATQGKGFWGKLQPGHVVMAVQKRQGMKKGETPKRVGPIAIEQIIWDAKLDEIDQAGVECEGFPDLTPAQFVDYFCRMGRCKPEQVVPIFKFRQLFTVKQRLQLWKGNFYDDAGNLALDWNDWSKWGKSFIPPPQYPAKKRKGRG